MRRDDRAALAQHTVLICAEGHYTAPNGTRVELADAIASAIAGSRLYRPADLRAVLREAEADRGAPRPGAVSVTPESTLEAAERLCRADPSPVMVLNFASAKNPGGGFLGGSQAQEESLARSSALYPTLQAHPGYYDANRHERSALYTDHVIVSPDVPVFRRDDGELLAEPYEVTFVTAPAVNAGVVHERGGADVERIEETMRRRIELVLALAVVWDCRRLVLGAWGCGVFRNDPDMVADLFGQTLERGWNAAFDEIVFAIYDRTRGSDVFRVFQERFA